MKALKVVLLDVDGTLVDSNDAHAQAWLEVFERNGYQTSFERVRELIGQGGDKLLPQITGLELDSSRRKAALERALGAVPPELPAAAARVSEGGSAAAPSEPSRTALGGGELRKKRRADTAARAVRRAAVPGSANLCGRRAAFEAPTPTSCKRRCAKAACSSPARPCCWAIPPYDIQAATRAGVATIALRSGGHPDSALQGALALYDDAADLLAHFDTSVFARGAKGPHKND